MREAMASAAVGDDVYGEDPTVIELERRVAELLGKDSALFVPSGTMSNQIALLVHTRPGDEVVIGEGAHIAFYESGAGAALAGVQFAEAGAGGLFDAEELSAVVKPQADYHPRTSLVCLENTHNRAGGRIFPQATLERVVERARQHGLSAHLDGARLWHAAIATGISRSGPSRAIRHRERVLFEGLGRAGRLGAGRRARRAARGATLSQDAGRRHATSRNFGGRRAVRARASAPALEPRSRRGAADSRALLAALPGVRVVPPETNIVSLALARARRAGRGARSAQPRRVAQCDRTRSLRAGDCTSTFR